MNDGTTKTEVFLIPSYCHFLTRKTKKDVLAMQKTYDGHHALIQAIVDRLVEIRIEMRS